MCEACTEFSQLLVTCEARLTADISQYPTLRKSEVEIVLAYIVSWPQRQCMCCYREPKNFDRFNLLVQSLLCLSVCQLKVLKNDLLLKNKALEAAALQNDPKQGEPKPPSEEGPGSSKTDKTEEETLDVKPSVSSPSELNNENSTGRDSAASEGSDETEYWTMQQKEKLIHIVSKIFLLNFPLYIACKHSAFSRLDDLSAQEISNLSCYCDLHDTEIPVYLLRNVNLFCKSGGICAMMSVFENATPENLPVSMAHSIVSAVGDLKLWLNYRAVTQFFLPFRSKVLKYMCSLEDKDLRLAVVKTMADFMWGAVKDPLDTPVTFDCDGLDLAFKYFSSSTLTMRLAGITQINTQISVFNEMCASEPVPEAETVGQRLAQWLCDNQIMQHLFGPNLHVEVIKHAHIILKFLAVENRITKEMVELIWQAAQLKHCSKQVYDLLPGFIKNLAAGPCSHLYQLLCSLPPREHTEQSLYLASVLMRVMWSRSSQAAAVLAGGVGQLVSGGGGGSAGAESRVPRPPSAAHVHPHPPACDMLHHDSSSEASVSMDPTNSDEDNCEELSTSGEDAGPTPRKQSKQQNTNSVDEQKWLHEENNPRPDEETLKATQKRVKDDGASSGSASSGVEDIRHPPKKKVLRKRKNTRRGLFADIAKVELGELIESISDAEESSGSEADVCGLGKVSGARGGHVGGGARSPPGGAVALLKHAEPCAPTLHECPTLCDGIDPRQLMELLSGDDGEASLSSAMTNKSDKNMADFDGEESGCEEELARLAAQAQCMGGYRVSAGMGMLDGAYGDLAGCGGRGGVPPSMGADQAGPGRPGKPMGHHDPHAQHFNLKMDDVCKPGNTLLWDLLQDQCIKQLGEDLALEAEKALCTLLGYNTDKFIRFKFIEGCLDNLANHRSVSVSLRLLPKLFSSFQQLRGMDMHQVVMWAEHEHRMMELFFLELRHYMRSRRAMEPPPVQLPPPPPLHTPAGMLLAQTGLVSPLFSHISEITVRLQFLTTIFSPLGSPNNFRLTLEQVDTLWTCLAHDPECSDCLFSWLLSHAKSSDQHALSIDALRYLYVEKMPTLNPETISIMGLSLYQQLCNLTRMALGQGGVDSKDQTHPHVLAMDHLWKIALKANSTDVSMGAIQYLNSYYMGQHLQQEEDFVSQCMSHLDAAAKGLSPFSKSETLVNEAAKNSEADDSGRSSIDMAEEKEEDKSMLDGSGSSLANTSSPRRKNMNHEYPTEEASLQCIQRALLLLKTHLDTFKRRYAYHLRRWALSGNSVCGSSMDGLPLKVIVQPGGVSLKATLNMHNNDYVADLRAQVAIWWEHQVQCEDGTAGMVTDGPIRMITQGQELIIDYDERTLYDMGFKDNQLVFVSVGGARGAGRGGGAGGGAWGDWPSQQPPPPRSLLPTLLLLKPLYFDRLFLLMQTLGEMTMPGSKGERIAHMKAQLLSRRVWDILHAVPLSPALLSAFQNPEETRLPELLDPGSPQHLMYGLHIVDKLSTPVALAASPSGKRGSTSLKAMAESPESGPEGDKEQPKESWSQLFIRNGGLRHLYDILMSGILQSEDGEDSEWRQDCLVLLLKLIGHLGTVGSSSAEGQAPPKLCEILTIPPLHESLLSLMEVESTTKRLMSILCEAARPRDPSLYKTGFWGRAQVVQHCMWLLVCWAHSSPTASLRAVCSPSVQRWLPRLLLEDPQPQVRREACSALYRLCLGGGGGGGHVVPAILQHLLEHLPRAEGMRPCKIEAMHHHAAEEGKEPYGPACRDYFWLVCRLVDGLPSELIKETGTDESSGLDLNTLCHHLTDSVASREIIERREEPSVPDDGLFGQLNVLTHLVKHPIPFKSSDGGKRLLDLVFGFLFDVAKPSARLLPKCKSQKSRAAAYDLLIELVKGAPDNYMILHNKLMEHHQPGPHSPYPWDYWPLEEGRSECGYVGLTNLGATCYMASCMQHLYMMPQARAALLKADPVKSKHQHTLIEMQRMFAYLMESERKAYNPQSFCKVYQMDHQPLNTGEQKDMAEFFIDLVSKLEEMTPELKTLVKTLFCGVLSNNVVSLDCNHVSRTLEEFYTVRCQVADMRNLYESLNEVTVKDTLEGDNCYTCSQCSAKVRAEKRACFKKLPHILCFNTMRYTFNMVTMLKEKVNTHFSFPMRLDMSEYVEKHLMPAHYQEEKRKSEMKQEGEEDSESTDSEDFNENYEYELIGVTVHTGTADGGHYYSFIKERALTSVAGNSVTGALGGTRDKWLLFNDAEVKPFDPAQIAAECFGGEMTSKTYDSVTDKFMDFSFEKTNSAYMLFYERGSPRNSCESIPQQSPTVQPSTADMVEQQVAECRLNQVPPITLSPVLQLWIWEDNMHFLHHRNIFQHAYFTFMGQMCSCIPQSLLTSRPEITEIAAQLSTSFFIETFIHAKEKPTMVSWVELVTKQFNASAAASEWFLGHMASDTWWPMQVLIKCPNQMVRQMFQRLCIHVIQRLRSSHCSLYLQGPEDSEDSDSEFGEASCVTRFIKMLLCLMENGAKAHLRHLTEYFSLLYEFSKMGEEESQFLLKASAISMMVSFYLGHTSTSTADGSSSDEGGGDKLRPAALDKMVALVAGLVERSRDSHRNLNLTTRDQNALQGGKGFPFLYQQIRDCLNLLQTKTLIHALCRWNERLAQHVVTMIFQAIAKHTESCQPFFKLLTLLVEGSGSAPSGLPCFTQLALHRVWDAAESCPHAAIEWLAIQAPRNKMVHSWVLQTADSWVEPYLLAHSNQRVRLAAAFLLVALVPSLHFRQGYRTNQSRAHHPLHKDIILAEDAYALLHRVYSMLLGKLKVARKYIDVVTHGPSKLQAYFGVMTYCLVSRIEKIMFGQYFRDLWELFHPGLSEPSVPVHPNKQALLTFWHAVCLDCPENVELILSNPTIGKQIAFNYILADHEDTEVVNFNKGMLPPYYAILRLCCQCSPAFTRALSQHQNIHWAFKNITPQPALYPQAVEELFRLMQLFAARAGDASEQELREVNSFRRTTLTAYLQGMNGKTCWSTLISAFRTLVETDDDRLYIVYNGGLQLAFEALHSLHNMYHDGSGSGSSVGPAELSELLALAGALCRSLRACRDCKEARAALHACKDWPEALRRLATLLNTYNPPQVRNLSIALIKELLLLLGGAALAVLVPLLAHCHAAFQDARNALPPGPHFPVRGSPKLPAPPRPARPMVQMCVPHAQLQARNGVDPEYDDALCAFYLPYHSLLDSMCRLGVERGCCNAQLLTLATMAACEAVPLRFTLFPTLWHEIYVSEDSDRKYSGMLLECSYLVDYMDLVLLDERETLTDDNVHHFFLEYFPKVEGCKAVKSVGGLIAELESKAAEVNILEGGLLGDVRALQVLLPRAKVSQREHMLATLRAALQRLTLRVHQAMAEREEAQEKVDVESTAPVEVEKVSEDSEAAQASGEPEEGARQPSPAPSSPQTCPPAYTTTLNAALQSLLQIIDNRT